MVSKCANPACSARFLYLHEGRIFAVRPLTSANTDISRSVVERYWLCDTCAQNMTLVLHRDGVTLERLTHETEPVSNTRKGAGHRRRTAA